MQPLKKNEVDLYLSMVKDNQGILIKGKNNKFQEMLNPTYLEIYMYKKMSRQKSRRLHTKLLIVSLRMGVGGMCVNEWDTHVSLCTFVIWMFYEKHFHVLLRRNGKTVLRALCKGKS